MATDREKYELWLQQGLVSEVQQQVVRYKETINSTSGSGGPPADFRDSQLRAFIGMVINGKQNDYAMGLWMGEAQDQPHLRAIPCTRCDRKGVACKTIPKRMRCDSCVVLKYKCSLVNDHHAWLLSKVLSVEHREAMVFLDWMQVLNPGRRSSKKEAIAAAMKMFKTPASEPESELTDISDIEAASAPDASSSSTALPTPITGSKRKRTQSDIADNVSPTKRPLRDSTGPDFLSALFADAPLAPPRPLRTSSRNAAIAGSTIADSNLTPVSTPASTPELPTASTSGSAPQTRHTVLNGTGPQPPPPPRDNPLRRAKVVAKSGLIPKSARSNAARRPASTPSIPYVAAPPVHTVPPSPHPSPIIVAERIALALGGLPPSAVVDEDGVLCLPWQNFKAVRLDPPPFEEDVEMDDPEEDVEDPSSVKTLQGLVTHAKRERAARQQESDASEGKIKLLQEDVTGERELRRKQLKELETVKKKMQQQLVELNEARAKISSLEAAAERKQVEHQQEIAGAQQVLRALELVRDDQQRRMQEVQREAASLRGMVDGRDEQGQKDRNTARETLKALEAELSRAKDRAEREASTAEAAQRRVLADADGLRFQRDALQTRNETLQSTVDKLIADSTKTRDENEKLHAKVADLGKHANAVKESLRKRNDEFNYLANKLEEAWKRGDRMMSEVQAERSAKEEAVHQASRFERAHADEAIKALSAQVELEQLRAEKEEVDEEASQLRAAARKDADLRCTILEKDARIAELQEELLKVTSELKEANDNALRVFPSNGSNSSDTSSLSTAEPVMDSLEPPYVVQNVPKRAMRAGWKLGQANARAEAAEARLLYQRGVAHTASRSLGVLATRLEAVGLPGEDLAELSKELFNITGRLATLGAGSESKLATV